MTAETVVPLQHPVSRELHEARTRGERAADWTAEKIGSWQFLVIQSIVVSFWVVLNVVAFARRWDPYPFVLLNLLFSVQAAYTGPVLLLSANRAAQRDRIVAEHDSATNDKAEKLAEGIMSELLRNSHATLAIAEHLDVDVDALDAHQDALNSKMDHLQSRLGEVEDVVGDVEPPRGG